MGHWPGYRWVAFMQDVLNTQISCEMELGILKYRAWPCWCKSLAEILPLARVLVFYGYYDKLPKHIFIILHFNRPKIQHGSH